MIVGGVNHRRVDRIVAHQRRPQPFAQQIPELVVVLRRLGCGVPGERHVIGQLACDVVGCLDDIVVQLVHFHHVITGEGDAEREGADQGDEQRQPPPQGHATEIKHRESRRRPMQTHASWGGPFSEAERACRAEYLSRAGYAH
jgi:hypothetical protein